MLWSRSRAWFRVVIASLHPAMDSGEGIVFEPKSHPISVPLGSEGFEHCTRAPREQDPMSGSAASLEDFPWAKSFAYLSLVLYFPGESSRAIRMSPSVFGRSLDRVSNEEALPEFPVGLPGMQVRIKDQLSVDDDIGAAPWNRSIAPPSCG